MNEEKTESESDLFDKILHRKIRELMKDAPLTPTNELMAQVYKDYREQRWLTLLDTDRFHLTVDQYLDYGKSYGPDLMAIPTSRFDRKNFFKSGSRKHTTYENFRIAMKGKYSNDEIIKKWKSMSPEEKEKYKSIDLEKA